MSERRNVQLTTFDLWRLDRACDLLYDAYGWATYLVGTAGHGSGGYRDVDVRTILGDELFDQLFPTDAIWQAASVSMTAWLHSQTGLPIDFQYQRFTDANQIDGTSRNPLGRGGRRIYAGGGDATRFPKQPHRGVPGVVSDE